MFIISASNQILTIQINFLLKFNTMLNFFYLRSLLFNSQIKGLKKATSKGALYRKLYECLHYAPGNEKKVQATLSRSKDCNCQCTCDQRKKVKRVLESPTDVNKSFGTSLASNLLPPVPNNIVIQPQIDINMSNNNSSPKSNIRTSIDMPESDDIMLQLDKLFQGIENDDDLFDSALCMTDNSMHDKVNDDSIMMSNIDSQQPMMPLQQENQESQRCLDERLALLSGILVNNTTVTEVEASRNPVSISNNCEMRKTKVRTSKWLCEEYFQKVKLYEALDQIRDTDRNKFLRVGVLFDFVIIGLQKTQKLHK